MSSLIVAAIISGSAIHLRQVKTRAVKKIYGTINATEFRSPGLEQFLERIILYFVLNHNSSGEIVFYKHFENHPPETTELEHKAKAWILFYRRRKCP